MAIVISKAIDFCTPPTHPAPKFGNACNSVMVLLAIGVPFDVEET